MLKSKLIRLFRRLVSSEKTPLPIARLVQMARLGDNVKMRLCNPLRSIPEINSNRASFFLHQSNGVSYEERARHFVMAMEYVMGCCVEGDIAEFGTMTGTTARYLAASMEALDYMDGDNRRRLHLFDSFQGFPKADNTIDLACPQVVAGHWTEGECFGIGPRYLKAICTKFIRTERIAIHHGWFKETLPLLPKDQKFGLVHLDCDLYQSTKEVLDDLFKNDRLTDGAMLLFDDWLCSKANPAFGQQKAWNEILYTYEPRHTFVGHYANACAKIIVHKSC